MNFKEAMDEVFKGKRVRRWGWKHRQDGVGLNVSFLAATNFWTCSVTAPGSQLVTSGGIKIKMVTKHSGPCTTPAKAIGEAALLYRRYFLPNAPRMS